MIVNFFVYLFPSRPSSLSVSLSLFLPLSLSLSPPPFLSLVLSRSLFLPPLSSSLLSPSSSLSSSLSSPLYSPDDIICLSSCKSLIDLSIDGNPLSNTNDYRILLLSRFNQLLILNQTTITVSNQ